MDRSLKSVDILGVRVTPISSEDILTRVDQWVRYRQQHYICLCPNYSIMMSRKHPEFRQALNQATITTADGRAVAWACKLHGYRHAKQVRGADLTRLVCQMSAQSGFSNFCYDGCKRTHLSGCFDWQRSPEGCGNATVTIPSLEC
jgi:N-acetylglucosaminyldiphosphoundecaprenol N-acetyl-beta-D-mannosaminyltransferase